jgi:phage-related protein
MLFRRRQEFLSSYTISGILNMTGQQEKPLVWIGSSKRDLMALPVPVRKFFGHALDFAQRGDKHDAAQVLKGFGSAGVLEIIKDARGSTYRAVYTIKFKEAIFVLHVSRKKASGALQHPNRTWTSFANA